MVEELLKYVRKIETKDSILKVDNSKDIKLIKQISKYSSTKLPSLKLQFENIIIKRDDKLTYECPMCHKESTILVGRFLSKKSKFCYKCKENNEIKRKNHSDFITKSYKDFGKVKTIKHEIKKIETDDIIKNSKMLFELEDDTFKMNYFERNLTKEEFEKVKKNIKSIDRKDIDNCKVEYIPIMRTNNQMKYSPKIKINGKLSKFDSLEFYCSICGDDFKGRNIKNKNINGFMCPTCSFTNKVFKFRSIKNIQGKNVVYQSKPELKLINHCTNKNILIQNGPKIDYKFNNSNKKYKVDFEIPDFKLLVEIKDLHIWHLEQIESGKWLAKEKAAKDWSDKNGYRYYLIFEVDILIDNYL